MSFIRVDQLPSLITVPTDALVPVWSAGQLWSAPRSSIDSGGGGGAGYSFVEANGVQLAQRDTINFTGLLIAADSGGKTVVTLGNVNLTSQVTGVLPIANGGTGLSTLGTAGQSVRVNVGGTGLEYYTPSSGLTAPVNPGDNGKPAVASGGNLSYTLLTTSHLSASAGIQLSQLQALSADRLLGADSAGAPAQLTVSGGLEFTGAGGIQRGALTGDVTAAAGSGTTSIANGAVTLAKLAAAPQKGQSFFYGSSSWQLGGPKTRASDLTDANATLAVADGARAVLPAGTLTANREAQFSLVGATEKRFYTVERYDTNGFTYTVKNSAGTVIYTFLAGTAAAAVFQYTAGEWIFSGDFPL